MTKRYLATTAAVLITLSSAGLEAAGLYIIAGPDTALAQADVREAFLGDKQFAGATKLVPVDNTAAQAEFLTRVLRLAPAKYSAAWLKKSFRDGLNPPPIKGSDSEVLEFVRRTPGAIGYVSSKPRNVTIVQEY